MAAGHDIIEADFIVIGAGSAGCTVAARLSEDRNTRVLLLEAGGDDTNRWIHIPLGFGKTFADPSVNWCYETEADASGRKVYWPRGKVLGGSSSINGMVYIRGQAEDFDHWRQLGNTGWSFDDVLPYFKRAEDQQSIGDEFHGNGGPLAVSDVAKHPICEALIDSATAMGFARNDDFNGATQDGVGYHQTTTRNGKRCSTAVGYLNPARGRANLQIVTNALSERIVVEGGRATAVIYRQGGVLKTARARREIVLCGGAINSPQLLMLSGIGPAAHLAEHGIEVVQNLPGVGQNLQDHYSAPIKLKCSQAITVNDVMLSNIKKLKVGHAILHVPHRPVGDDQLAGGVVRAHPAGALHPRHQMLDLAVQRRPAAGRAAQILRLYDDRLPASPGKPRRDQAEKRQPGRPAGDDPQLPFRRNRPAHHRRRPEAVPANCWRTRRWRALSPRSSSPARRCRAMPSGSTMPAGAAAPSITRPAPARWGSTRWRWSTPSCKVIGVEGLRVADASVMPTVISGNTNAATIMVGEKLADLVRQRMRLAA